MSSSPGLHIIVGLAAHLLNVPVSSSSTSSLAAARQCTLRNLSFHPSESRVRARACLPRCDYCHWQLFFLASIEWIVVKARILCTQATKFLFIAPREFLLPRKIRRSHTRKLFLSYWNDKQLLRFVDNKNKRRCIKICICQFRDKSLPYANSSQFSLLRWQTNFARGVRFLVQEDPVTPGYVEPGELQRIPVRRIIASSFSRKGWLNGRTCLLARRRFNTSMNI